MISNRVLILVLQLSLLSVGALSGPKESLFPALQEKSSHAATVVGFVRDSVTRGPLVGATIRVDSSYSTTSTDSTGRYVVSGLAPGIHEIRVAYIGYESNEPAKVLLKSGQAMTLDISILDFQNGAEVMARRDIAHGLVRILIPGFQIGAIPDSTYTDKYGFRYDLNCSVWGSEDKYNAVVVNYLNKRNGVLWQSDLDFEWKYLRGLHKIK